MSAGEMVCPVCGSSEVTGDSWEMDAAAAQSWQEVNCDDCGSSWDDVYRFSHRENVRRGSRVAVALARHGVADVVAGWVFHNLETGTVDGVGADSWLLDVDTLTADELRHLHDADSLGWFDTGADEIVRARGVAMSEVLDALAIVRRLDAAGLTSQVLGWLAAEEGGDEDEEDDEWTDCNDDGGAVCNAAAGFPCSACAAAREVKA